MTSLVKKTIALCLLVLSLAGIAFAKNSPNPRVSFDRIPQDMTEFVTLRDSLANTPQGGATLFVVALYIFSQDQVLGKDCLTVALDYSSIRRVNPGGYNGWEPNMSVIESARNAVYYPEIARSYFEGTSFRNNYRLAKNGPYSCWFEISLAQRVDINTYKVFIYSNGDNQPRSITVKQNDRGLWKVVGEDSLRMFARVWSNDSVSDDL